MDGTNNISIGEDKYIQWIEIPYFKQRKQSIEIDELLKPTIKFWHQLEVNCVGECCGLDAFSFWAKDIKAALEDCSDEMMLDKLRVLMLQIEFLDQELLESSFFNQIIQRTVFLKLLHHINQSIIL